MTTPAFEAFLARLYVEADFRADFLLKPRETARAAGLSDAECEAVEKIDREGLKLAAASFAGKRKRK